MIGYGSCMLLCQGDSVRFASLWRLSSKSFFKWYVGLAEKWTSALPQEKSRGGVDNRRCSAIHFERDLNDLDLRGMVFALVWNLSSSAQCVVCFGLAVKSDQCPSALLHIVDRAGCESCTIKERAVLFSREPVLSHSCFSFSELGRVSVRTERCAGCN